MTDEQFDDLARKALAIEASSPSEAVWARIKPVRWKWLPTIPEIMICGCTCALLLGLIGLRIIRNRPADPEPNPVIVSALHDAPSSTLAEVTSFPDQPSWSEQAKLGYEKPRIRPH